MSTALSMFFFTLLAVMVGVVLNSAGYKILACICWMGAILFFLYMGSLM